MATTVPARRRSTSSRPRSVRSWSNLASSATAPRSSRPGCGSTAARQSSRAGTPARPSCPGKPGESLLVQAVAHTHDELKMPPKKKLPDPAVAAHPALGRARGTLGDAGRQRRPPRTRHVPTGRSPRSATSLRPRSTTTPGRHSFIDAFVLARLEQEGLTPSPPADRRTLIRRATIDLLGIPPTAEEIEAFEADPAPDAFATPGRPPARLAPLRRALGPALARRRPLRRHQGLRLPGRAAVSLRLHLPRLRDPVLQRATCPFDRFVLEQLAADQLDLGGDPAPLAAMGFLTVGRRFLNDQNEIIDDRIDVVGRGLLGLTLGCARCHDHKFDPIPSEDYYSLYGVFASSVEPDELPRLDRPGETAKPETEAIEARDRRRPQDPRRLPGRAAGRARERPPGAILQVPEGGLRPGAQPPAPEARRARGRRQARPPAAPRRDLPLEAPARVGRRGPRPGPRPAGRRSRRTARRTPSANRPRSRRGRRGTPHPLLREGVPRAGRPPRWTRSSPGTSTCSPSWKHAAARSTRRRSSRAGRWPSPNGNRSAWRSSGPAASSRSPPTVPGSCSTAPSASGTPSSNNAVQQLEAKSAGKAGRAMVMNDAPQPVEPHVFIRGNPGRPGKTGAPAVPQGPGRPRPPAVPEGERPARAGPGDRRPDESR